MNNQQDILTRGQLIEGGLVDFDPHHKHIKTNSLKVASYFGKRPSDVNRRIGYLAKKGLCKIAPSYYLNKQNKQQKFFILNRDQFLQVALGFTGVKAEHFRCNFIHLFNQKEQQLEHWQTGRLQASESTKLANDSIYWLKTELEKVIPKSNRCKMLFVHIQQGINKATTCHATAERSLLDKEQLEAINTLENTVRSAIEDFKTEGMPAEQVRDEVMALIKFGGNHETRKNLPRRQSEAGFQCVA